MRKLSSEFLLNDFAQLQDFLKEQYKNNFIENQKDKFVFTFFEDNIPLSSQTTGNYLVDASYKNDEYHLHFPLARNNLKELIPIYIITTENPSKEDKLQSVIKALIFNAGNRIKIKEIHFLKSKTSTICKTKVSSLSEQAKKVLAELQELCSGKITTKSQWQPHCQVCCFKTTCRKELEENGDLSLLSGLSMREIAKKREKGIFSITQLSYAFSPKKKLYTKKKFLPELKALALREQKTYVIKAPQFNETDTELFFDIEGIPDRKHFYLIGLIIKQKDGLKQFSFWDDENSTDIFTAFLDYIEPYQNCRFYHFGSFEIIVLKHIAKIIKHQKYLRLIAFVIEHSVNLLKEFSESVYPPTYTNSLKEIANFLGFEWQDKDITGYRTIFLSKQWQLEKNSNIKAALIRYNMDDCKALIVVKDWLSHIERNEFITKVSSMKVQSAYKFGDTGYIIPEMKEINQFAYFNYQRDKVYFKTSRILKTVKNRGFCAKAYKANESIMPPKLDKCPYCNHEKLYKHLNNAKIVIDLKITSKGIKRWVISFEKGRFRCAACYKVFNTNNLNDIPKYGRNLMIWSVNQNISYNISFRNIAQSIKEQFDIHLPEDKAAIFNSIIAEEYSGMYQNIQRFILSGRLVQIDESQINIKGFGAKCYVWAFATIDSVFYLFRENREADFLKSLLKDFKGVVVSDFYTGYDSLECAQQKCLIHLMRDLNDDLLKNPFNEEFKFIINRFTILLRQITDTINKYGLKKRHFNKHIKDTNRFFDSILTKRFKTELALAYCKKIRKYRERLFTFLKYDGVPWNNNNAEVAIKPFAIHRNHIGGLHTKKGINDYLILLSIQQTCKYRNLNFYDFLKSGAKEF